MDKKKIREKVQINKLTTVQPKGKQTERISQS